MRVAADGDAVLLRAAKRGDVTRVICMGDTHSRHHAVTVPDGEVLLHSGDFTMFGNRAHVESFNNWLGTLPHQHKIVIAGNHDSGMHARQDGLSLRELEKLLTNAVYLSDGFVDLQIDGDHTLRVYGSPWQPQFRGFGSFKPDKDAGDIWERTMSRRDVVTGRPTTHVVLTHTPPRSMLDSESNGDDRDGVGSPSLFRIVKDRRPLLHCFGHIHNPGGQTVFANFETIGAENNKNADFPHVNDPSVTLTMAREGQTLFVNDALATNNIAKDGAYELRDDAKPVVVGIPNELLSKAPSA